MFFKCSSSSKITIDHIEASESFRLVLIKKACSTVKKQYTSLQLLTFSHRTGGSKRWHGAVTCEVFNLASQELAVLHQILHLPLESSDAFLFALQHALQLGDGQQHPRGKTIYLGSS